MNRDLHRAPAIINVAENYFHEVPGGVARLAHELCLKQREWGYRVFLICVGRDSALPSREERQGITILRCPPSRYPSPHPLNLWAKIRDARAAVRQVLAEVDQVAALHTHSPMVGIGAMQAMARSSARKIHSIHSPWALEMRHNKNWESPDRGGLSLRSRAAYRSVKFLEAKCFSLADILTSDSHYTRTECLRDHGAWLRAKPFQVAPGWVDTDRFSVDGPRTDWQAELGRPARRPVFFTVRALIPRNGLELLLEAAAALKAQGHEFELVIGGDGVLRPSLQAQIRELQLADRATLLGRIPDERLPILYRSCDFFVLPTTALECFGVIILEALASGKAVIATPVGSIPEILQPIFPEGLLPEASVSALTLALVRQIRTWAQGGTSLAQREAFRNFICTEYSLARGTGRFRQLYESGLITP